MSALSTRYRLYRRYLRSRLVRSLLGARATAVLYDTPDGSFLIHAEDTTIGRRLGRQRAQGTAQLAELGALVGPTSRVLFVGAHVGTLLVPVARRVREVVGIEANPDTYRLLKLNLLLNEIGNATIHNVAAGDARRQVEFLQNRSNSGGSKIRPDAEHYEFVFDRPSVATVQMAPLDELVGAEPFDVVVMDVEGAETLALRGMQRVLASCRVLEVEYIRNHLDKVAGVTPAEFLGVFGEHFDHARALGDRSGRRWPRAEFPALLASVEADDLLFGKGDAL
jgi:FkbM family methyltransferase